MLARSVRENCILERPVGGLLETQAPEGQLRVARRFSAGKGNLPSQSRRDG